MKLLRGRAATVALLVMSTAFIALLAGATAYHLLQLRQSALQGLQATAASHARAFEDYLTQSLNLVDLTLAELLETTADLAPAQRDARLKAALRRAPLLRSLSLLDEGGRVVASTNPDNLGRAIEFGPLQPQAPAGPSQLQLGRPWTGRDLAEGRLVTPQAPADPQAPGFVPALRAGAGTQRLVAALNPDVLLHQFMLTLPPQEGVVDVFNLDRLRLFSTGDPPVESQPGSRLEAPLWGDDTDAPAQPGVTSAQRPQGPMAEAAYRASRRFPYTVVVWMDRELALQPWRKQVRAVLMAVVPAGILTVVLGALLFRRALRAEQEEMEAALRAHDRLAGRVFDSSTEAIVVTDAQRRIVSVNPAYRQMSGYEDAEVIGKVPHLDRSGAQDQAFIDAMWQTVEAQGLWRGELIQRRRDGAVYPVSLTVTAVRGDDGELLNYVGLFSDISERKAREDRIRYLSEHDCLTGLPNRAVFQDRLQQAIAQVRRSGHRIALLFIDLDHFKSVNDNYGHPVGDELLRQVAQRLRAQLREGDTVCRQGGDEFLVMLPDANRPQCAVPVIEKLVASLLRPYRLGERELRVTVSAGISVYPDDGEDLDALIKAADTAMYHTKASGRAAFQFYSTRMNSTTHERAQLHSGLARALDERALLLHYQPVVDLASGRLCGVEALLRWRDPTLGEVPPARFIALAEQSGLIVPIGQWVLHEACRQMRAWVDQGLAPPSVAVNVSVMQFGRDDFVDSVLQALATHGLAGSALEVEITESLLVDDDATRIEQLQRLRAAGVRVSIDDFGTGYSSLSYLRRLPADAIKVDRTFVASLTEQAQDALIVGALIDMAHGLGLRVVAEGVETAAQRDLLRARGCDAVQGFLYSPPLAAEALADWVRLRAIAG